MNILKIPYPTPLNFTLAWCKEKIKFSRVVSGFLDWWERRAERKRREKEYRDKMLDRHIRELQCEREIFHQKFEIYKKLPFEKHNDPLPVDQEWEIRQKWRKRYGLD